MTNNIIKIVAELNSIRITVEELTMVVNEVHKLSPEGRDWEGRAMLMVRLFAEDQDPDKTRKIMAIDHRLTAMSKIIDSGVLPHWVLPKASDGSVAVSEPVWLAAAESPLLLKGNNPYFETTDFVNRVLSLADVEGEA